MYAVDTLILLAGILLLVAIVSSKISARVGVPGLILFMGVGMLAGEAGPGGLAFEDYSLAHAAGTVALVMILFDGGLQTTARSFRAAWGPALSLATFGVLLTAGLTGILAAWILDLPLLVGLLLGSIVGSTDAAAVFAVLRGQGLHLRERIGSTLEVESGSNDPMAVLLTLGLVSIVVGDMEPGWGLAWFFVQQAALGALGGIAVGWLGAQLVNRVELNAAGLYPVLTLGTALLAYGIPAYLGGSGFLSVYLAGLVLGNSRIVFQRGIFMAHDGGAWMAQIAMFIMLGLLASPVQLVDVAPEGTLVALGLIFVARPAAVFITLAPFRFPLRELLFLCWGGLKGAIPIILAIYPLLLGVPQGMLLFNVVFFVVILSALTQGWTLPVVARLLGVREERAPSPPVTLEITSLKHVDGDIVEYRVEGDALAANLRVRELALPETAVIAMLSRGSEIIPPRGSTHLRPGDHVFVVMKHGVRGVVDALFAPREAAERVVAMEFLLGADTSVGDVEEFYGIHLDPDPTRTLGSILVERLGTDLTEGAEVVAGEVRLAAHEIRDGKVEYVGVEILSEGGKVSGVSPGPTPGGGGAPTRNPPG